MTDTTSGLVCGHHHLYSTLARGMPAPPHQPTGFRDILEQVWWRVDAALDLEMLKWSAMLGAVEALQCGTTALVDHHESPNAIEGSLDVIADGVCRGRRQGQLRVRRHRPSRHRRSSAWVGRERAVPARRRSRHGGRACRVHLSAGDAAKRQPSWRRTSVSACTSTWARDSSTSRPVPSSSRLQPTTG